MTETIIAAGAGIIGTIAGVISTFRDDGSEWWRLLSRMDEYIARKK